MKVRLLCTVSLGAICAAALACAGNLAFAEEAKDVPEEQAKNAFTLEKWPLERILAMGRDEIIALWKTLPPPEFTEMDGHYMGLVPNADNKEVYKSTAFTMYNHDSPLGYWLGKAYKPTSATKGEGYNRWRKPGGKIVRNLRFGTEMGKSLIDGEPAFMMYYSAFDNVSGRRDLIDEIRKLDDHVYLGLGAAKAPDGGRTAPGHFVLVGPTDEWVGVDDDSSERK